MFVIPLWIIYSSTVSGIWVRMTCSALQDHLCFLKNSRTNNWIPKLEFILVCFQSFSSLFYCFFLFYFNLLLCISQVIILKTFVIPFLFLFLLTLRLNIWHLCYFSSQEYQLFLNIERRHKCHLPWPSLSSDLLILMPFFISTILQLPYYFGFPSFVPAFVDIFPYSHPMTWHEF